MTRKLFDFLFNDPTEKDRSGFVYLLTDGSGSYKIGCAKDPEKRISALNTGSSVYLKCLGTIDTENMYSFEKALHREFAEYRDKGEWFRFGSKQAPALTNLKKLFNPV